MKQKFQKAVVVLGYKNANGCKRNYCCNSVIIIQALSWHIFLLQGFCPLTLEVTFKEALDWTLQLKGKIGAFCRIYPEVCELCQDILTYPCLWQDLSQGVKAVMLFNDYKNRKLTKNEFRKSLCKFTSCSTGCYIGYYAGASLGKYSIKSNFIHTYTILSNAWHLLYTDIILSSISQKLRNYILQKNHNSNQQLSIHQTSFFPCFQNNWKFYYLL